MAKTKLAQRMNDARMAPPCIKLSCGHVELCEARELACELFKRYIAGHRWEGLSEARQERLMQPSRHKYRQVFSGEGE